MHIQIVLKKCKLFKKANFPPSPTLFDQKTVEKSRNLLLSNNWIIVLLCVLIFPLNPNLAAV